MDLAGKNAAFFERPSLSFGEHRMAKGALDELLLADIFFVGDLNGIGKVCLHAVFNTCVTYVFGSPNNPKQQEAAVAVLPFHARTGLRVKAVLIDSGQVFCRTKIHS